MDRHIPGDVDEEGAELAATLHGTWFGAELDEPTLRRLATLGRRRQVAVNEIILSEGSPSDELGVVVSGRLALRMLVPERGTTTILTVEPGDLYGWSAIVPPNRSTSTVIAVETAELVAFDGAGLREALAADPGLAAAVYPRVLMAVSRRLEATRLQLLDLFAQRTEEPW